MKNNKKITVIILIMIALSLFVYVIKKQKQQVREDQVSIYFVKQVSTKKNQVVPVKRMIKLDKIETAINELLKGPSIAEKDFGLFTEIPEKTKLIGIKESPDKVEINLSNDFGSGGGSESMKLRLRQVSYTAIDAADGKPVYLNLNDKKAKFIGGEGLEIPQPLVREKNK
ncbi:MAG: GerMN domain-containing protein [Candidatus Gastranaerophilales bacterium]|nr:GerMN domain-containing protein [Candidatus Gastranaerophilales bacterium]